MLSCKYYCDESGFVPTIPKASYPLTSVSKTSAHVTMDDVREHMAMLFPINKPPMLLPTLASQSISIVLLSLGRLYIILKGGNRYTVMYTSKGLRQIEGPKAKDGSTTYYKGFVEWCEKVGAKYEDILVAGKPKHRS